MSSIVKKKLDPRLKKLVETGIANKHRSFLILIGKRGKSQIVNLHWLLTRCSSLNDTPSILWCYRDELGFSPNHVKQVQKIKKDIKRGLRTPNMSDPFESFILSHKIRYTKFKDSAKILGQTFDCLIIQNFESITPNLLARTVETVAGGGLIIFLLETIQSLKQLFTLSMDVHKRFRTPSHTLVIPRFNERFTLSLADCSNCLICDDELNVVPITSFAVNLMANSAKRDALTHNDSVQQEEQRGAELQELKEKLKDTKPVGNIIDLCLTVDQAKCVLLFLEAIAEKTLSSTVVLTAARGRGKSAALGLAVAGAVSLQYANIFVTSPTPENLKTFFEITLKAFDALGYVEHTDYEVIQSTNPDFHGAIVRINVFKQHRQTIQYIQPSDAVKLSQAELLVIDEAAAIPLPTVKQLMGPYLVFLSSTVNGYEGTGRSLSLKLVENLRKQSMQSHERASSSSSSSKSQRQQSQQQQENARKLREISLEEPIRYAEHDPIELWLNDLLCLNCCSEYNVNSRFQHLAELNLTLSYHPDPDQCELYYVNRDSLFSYNKISEYFLQNMMSLYVAGHYKNQPNDLQLMSDAPAHQLFVLLPPQKNKKKSRQNVHKLIPDILCVIQVCFEGNLTKKIIKNGLLHGKRLDGDLIPWVMSQQFQDDDFGKLSGARIVRIATHPHIQSMGYGSKALSLLIRYFEGKMVSIDEHSEPPRKKQKTMTTTDGNAADIHHHHQQQQQQMTMPTVRDDLPVLLTNVSERTPEKLHWLGVSYGLTLNLFKFWKRNAFSAVYIRQRANEVTGEHSCVMVRPLHNHEVLDKVQWIDSFCVDFKRRFQSLMAYAFQQLDLITALSVLDPKPSLLENNRMVAAPTLRSGDEDGAQQRQKKVIGYVDIMAMFSDWDLKRLQTYQKNLIDYNLIMDMIPKFCALFFNDKFGGELQLNYTQCAVLLAIGFQHKNVEQISTELNVIRQQTISMLNKAIRKIYALLDKIIKTHVESTQALPQLNPSEVRTNTMFDPMKKLSAELKQIGYKKKKQEELESTKLVAAAAQQDAEEELLVPDTVSIKVGERLVTMPKKENPSNIDPQSFKEHDRAHGINPSSRYHWNKNKKNNSGQKQKKRESKILEVFKKEKKKHKTKLRKHKEEYFVSERS